jgi:hypothetical protein
MKREANVSYLSSMYYTAAALFLFSALFGALSHSYTMAARWLILGSGLFAFRFSTSKKHD